MACPCIVIDPKGDLTNLLLTFPDYPPDDFEPWVNEDDAQRAGLSVAEFAADQAARWKKGLAEWGQDGARIQSLRDAAEFTIYTPGSTAGLPVSVLGILRVPPQLTIPSCCANACRPRFEPAGSDWSRHRCRSLEEPRTHPSLDLLTRHGRPVKARTWPR